MSAALDLGQSFQSGSDGNFGHDRAEQQWRSDAEATEFKTDTLGRSAADHPGICGRTAGVHQKASSAHALARQPTKTELEAHQRRTAFRKAIEDKAAALLEPREESRQSFLPRPGPSPAEVVAIEAPSLALPAMKKPWFAIVGLRATAPMRVSEIQDVVCEAFGIDLVQLCAERRTAPLVRARQVGMYLAKTMTGRSLPEIGRRFGGRDHTTVLHAVRKIEAKVEFNAEAPELLDPELSDLVKALRAAIEARRGE